MFRGLLALAFGFLASISSASAQDHWVLLGSREIELSIAEVSIDLDSTWPVKQLRLVATRGAITLSKVIVHYDNGRIHTEERRINLLAGERTKPIDPRAEAAVADRVALILDRNVKAEGITKLAVWGLGSKTKAPSMQSDGITGLTEQIAQLHRAGRHVKALALQRIVAARIEKAEAADAGKPGPKTAAALGSLAWYALFARDFSGAMAASLRAHALAPDELIIETNRAHALLFLGRFDEARALYIAHTGKGPLSNNVIWEDTIAEDFEAFRKAKLKHSDFGEILAAIGIDVSVTKHEIEALNDRIQRLNQAGKRADALPVAERYVALARRRYGEGRLPFAVAMSWLAMIHHSSGHTADAEPLYERSLAIYEKTLGSEHLNVGTVLSNLAELSRQQGRNAKAEPLYQRSLAIQEKALGPDHPQLVVSLSGLASIYLAQARYTEAEPLYKRSIDIHTKTLGSEHLELTTHLSGLASVYLHQGRHLEAETLFRQVLSICEKALGPDHSDVATALNDLGLLYSEQGRYAEAEQIHNRSLEIRVKALGPDHINVGATLHNLAGLYVDQGRYTEAESYYNRSLAIFEKSLGADHRDVGTSLNGIGLLYWNQGRYHLAEGALKRSLAIREKASGADHPDVATSLNNLALVYRSEGRFAEAEPLFRRSLEIREKALGLEHALVANSLNNLAWLYEAQSRYTEAEPLYKRAIAVYEKVLGPEHTEVARTLDNVAHIYSFTARFAEAEPLYKRALEINERSRGPEHPDVSTSLNNLSVLYFWQARYQEAEPLVTRAIAISEKVLGPDHPHVAAQLSSLAAIYMAQDRYREAAPLLRRSLEIRENSFGQYHRDVANDLNRLARFYFWQDDFTRAYDFALRATQVSARLTQRGTEAFDHSVGDKNSEAVLMSSHFIDLVKMAHRLKQADPARVPELSAATFQISQWAQSSEAARSLAQMAARNTGVPTIDHLVRERQDLKGEWQARGALLSAAMSKTPDKRIPTVEQGHRARLAAIGLRIAEINAVLERDFPDYAALAGLEPLSIDLVQALLRDSEALVVFVDMPEGRRTPEETFIWVVTKTDLHWVRSDLGTLSLKREVAALRCGLDAAMWTAPTTQDCAGLLSPTANKTRQMRDPLPFDHARAHKFYKALFGEIDTLIEGKQLLIVPSGALTQLPFQVLVTAPRGSDDHKPIDWLIRRHAITILPAVSSLMAVRRKKERLSLDSRKPYIAFANPLLSGDAGDDDARRARQASARSSCSMVTELRAVAADFQEFTSLGEHPLPEFDWVRKQRPVPYTADLACDVGASLQSSDDDVYLAARATETNVKALLGGGKPAPYRIVNFATHGIVAGPLDTNREPGLILTPPETGSEADNGYLSASEVASLRLDADLVILAGCNTAAGGAGNAEALSGLARAFFYAGARALLVSHWRVREDAAAKLVSNAVANPAHASLGRAEAMRRSMLALADSTNPIEAHPAYWAPFVVVGEGGAGK